jgi:hypothetical protein
MTDDNTAVSGYDAGYVPCPDLAAAEPATDDNGTAVSGFEEGYVAVGDAGATEPTISDNGQALSGFSEGYVAGPCDCCCDTFSRVVLGDWGVSEICPHPLWYTLNARSQAAVDGSVGIIEWGDDANPDHLNASQALDLPFTGPPIEFRTLISTNGQVPYEAFITLENMPTVGHGHFFWLVDLRGVGPTLDVIIEIHGPNGGIASGTASGILSVSPGVEFWIDVLCDGRDMKLKAWNVGDPIPSSWMAVAGPFSSVFGACGAPTRIVYAGGTFTGSGVLGRYFVADTLCIIQGLVC